MVRSKNPLTESERKRRLEVAKGVRPPVSSSSSSSDSKATSSSDGYSPTSSLDKVVNQVVGGLLNVDEGATSQSIEQVIEAVVGDLIGVSEGGEVRALYIVCMDEKLYSGLFFNVSSQKHCPTLLGRVSRHMGIQQVILTPRSCVAHKQLQPPNDHYRGERLSIERGNHIFTFRKNASSSCPFPRLFWVYEARFAHNQV